MEVVDRPHIVLERSAAHGGWCLHHTITREVARLPDEWQHRPVLQWDGVGDAFVTRAGGDGAMWAHDVLKTHAVVADGVYFIVEEGQVYEWHNAISEFEALTWDISSSACRLVLKGYRFRLQQACGSKMCWSLPEVVTALQLDIRRCRSGFLHRRWPGLVAWAEKHGWGKAHFRLAAPTAQAAGSVLDHDAVPPRNWRVLPHMSASTIGLLALSTKWSVAVRGHRNMSEVRAWTSFLSALVGKLKCRQVRVPRPSCRANAPGQEAYACLRLEKPGVVNTSALRDPGVWTDEQQAESAQVLASLASECEIAALLQGFYAQPSLRDWWAELVVAVALSIEREILVEQVTDMDADPTDDEQHGGTLSALGREGCVARPRAALRSGRFLQAMQASMASTLQQQMLRYFWACRRRMSSAECVHMSIDASRIGNRNCSLTAFGDPSGEKELFVWGPPQVLL